MEGNQTSLIESSDSDIKKLMASAVPESTKKSPKYAVNVFEVKKVTSRLLIFSPNTHVKGGFCGRGSWTPTGSRGSPLGTKTPCHRTPPFTCVYSKNGL